MAKPTAPLLSFGARGQIGKTMVAASWKGRPYFRQYVIPGNPKSAEQTITRTLFGTASDLWKIAPPNLVSPWDLWATGQVKTGRNGFMGSYTKELRGETDFTNLVFSPGAKGGLACTSIGLTPGAGEITMLAVNPTPPTGWTIELFIGIAIADGDPEDPPERVWFAEADAVTKETVTFTGLTASIPYRVGGFLLWKKPDGSNAYGPSLSDVDTPT